jgi:hypothetical protein
MSRRVRPVNPTWRLSQWMREPSLPVRSRLATPGCAIPDNRQQILAAFQATVEKLGDWRHDPKIAIPSLCAPMWGVYETMLTRDTTTRAQLLKHKNKPFVDTEHRATIEQRPLSSFHPGGPYWFHNTAHYRYFFKCPTSSCTWTHPMITTTTRREEVGGQQQ